MQPSAVPAVGMAVGPPPQMAPDYDSREIAFRVLNFWGMMVMITGILALLCSIFAGIPAIVAGSIILCECCRGGSFLTRSSAGTVITLSIISAIISPIILIAYVAVAITLHASAYIAPIFILTTNSITSAVLAAKTRKHRNDLPDFASTMAIAPPDAILVAAPSPYNVTGGGYPAYPMQQTGGAYPSYPTQPMSGMYPPPPGPSPYGAPQAYGQPPSYPPQQPMAGQPEYSQAPPPGKIP